MDSKKPSKLDNQNEKNIVKMNKILSDNNGEEKVFDLLFVSMQQVQCQDI